MCLKEFFSCWSPSYEREGHDGSPDIRRYNDDVVPKLKPVEDPPKKIHEVNHSDNTVPKLKPVDDPPKKIHVVNHSDNAVPKLKPVDDPPKKIHVVNHSDNTVPKLKPVDDPPKKIHEVNHSDEEVSSNSPSKYGKGGHSEPSPQPTKTSEVGKNGKKITSAAAPKTTMSTDALSEDSAPKLNSTQSANIYSQEADQKNPAKFTESIEQQPKEKIDHEDIASTARSRDSNTVESKAKVEKNSFW